ncbi:MAG: PAS domain-containing protein [Alphaproteobacteria bacterium]
MFEELPGPQNRRARKLHDLWCRVKPRDDIPSRCDLSFERLGASGLLGHVFIIEPVDGGRDWQYRLLGSNITRFFEQDVTGIPFSHHFGAGVAEVCIALSNRAAQSRTPVFLRGRIQAGYHSGSFETMSLPIWSRDRSAVWLIGGSFGDY